MSIWLIPVLLLISNVELSTPDKLRFLAILHLFGDPIDSIGSLVDRRDSWDHCYRLAERYGGKFDGCKRVVAAVFASFEEIEGPQIKSLAYFNTIIYKSRLTNNFYKWRRTELKLADSRTDEFARTCLAILLYMFQLVAGFVKEVGGNDISSPPSGRIATGMFLSWLPPTVLLRNTIGAFTSRCTCRKMLTDFAERTGDSFYNPHIQSHLFSGSLAYAHDCITDFH